MVHHQSQSQSQSQRYFHHLKKNEAEEYEHGPARGLKTTQSHPRLLFLASLSVFSFTLIIWTCHPCSFPPGFSLLYSPEAQIEELAPLCSSISNGTICCDRSSHRTDICFMKGDIRAHTNSSSIFLYTDPSSHLGNRRQIEKVRPYTRKWETSVMNTVQELTLVKTAKNMAQSHGCDVYHNAPAVFFSTGGYTGNVYHEFNDGVIPLYITSRRFNKKVVFVILEYHGWWWTKYGNILSRLSDYPILDFNRDDRVHCFPEAVVGLRIHGELTVDAGYTTIRDFRNLLDRAYWPRIRGLIKEENKNTSSSSINSSSGGSKPKLVILSRNGSRSIKNEDSVVKMAKAIGFSVEVVRPDRTTELAKMYRVLNSSDVMMGVHGAAMTHFLFMRPGSVFIQIVPLGTEWAAATYYGEPAEKLGLEYIGYKILPRESSLYGLYDKDDPVLINPSSVVKKGWQFTKSIYLDNQSVHIDVNRFRAQLLHAYSYVMAKPAQVL